MNRASGARRVLSPVRGRALAAPSPAFASFAALTPRAGCPGHPRLAHTPLTGATRHAPHGSLSSFNGHGFGEIARLIDIVSASIGYVVREELQRYYREHG